MNTQTTEPTGVVSSTELGSGPVRIRLSRAKGWRMPPNTVKVDRTSRYGNDFVMAHEGARNEAISAFERQAAAQMAACPDWYAPLRGKNLACWCSLDKPCHADVLLRLANPQLSDMSAAIAEQADTPREVCTYPDCHCPFDAPADPNWCAKGLPHRRPNTGVER